MIKLFPVFIFFISALLVGSIDAGAAASSCPKPQAHYSVKVPYHPFDAVASSNGCWLFVSTMRRRTKDHTDPRGALVVFRSKNGIFDLTNVVQLQHMGLGLALSHDGKFLALAAYQGVMIFSTEKLENSSQTARMNYFRIGKKRVLCTQPSALKIACYL